MPLTSQTFIRSQCEPNRYTEILEETLAIDRRIFDVNGVDKYDNAKLFHDEADHDNIVVRMRDGEQTVGYGFVKIVQVHIGDRQVHVFQPLAGLLPQYVGGHAAMGIGIQTCFRVLGLCASPTYMVGFVINPGLYRGLSTILDNLYPGPRYVERTESLEATVLRAAIDRWQVPIAPGHEHASYFVTRDAPVVNRRAFRPVTPEDAFFLSANPRYSDGYYLAVCARMTWSNMVGAVSRELLRTVRRTIPWPGVAGRALPGRRS